MDGVVAYMILFGGVALFLLSVSPVGRAFADRIRGAVPPATDPQLAADVEALRHEVAELQERVDFTERLLAQRYEPERLEKGR